MRKSGDAGRHLLQGVGQDTDLATRERCALKGGKERSSPQHNDYNTRSKHATVDNKWPITGSGWQLPETDSSHDTQELLHSVSGSSTSTSSRLLAYKTDTNHPESPQHTHRLLQYNLAVRYTGAPLQVTLLNILLRRTSQLNTNQEETCTGTR